MTKENIFRQPENLNLKKRKTMTYLSTDLCDGVFETLKHRLTPDLKAFMPFRINGVYLGLLNQTFANRMGQDIDTIVTDEECFILDNMSWQEVADTLQHTAHQWYDNGLYSGWRDEKYSVQDLSGSPLFALERSAFRPLGFLSHAIHLNAWLEREGERYYWIGKRSSTKAVAPNKLDTTAGGGIAAGETAHTAMVRESFEEAGVPTHWTQALNENGQVFSLRPVHRGLHREILHLYDIRLPENFTPQNKDGEVAEFILMNDNQIAQAVINEQFMEDSALTLLINIQNRHKIPPNHPLNGLLLQIQNLPFMQKMCENKFQAA